MQIFLLAFILGMTPGANSKTPDPANYTVPVHVQSSTIQAYCDQNLCYNITHLIVLIAGKKYELAGTLKKSYVIRTGDYKARVAKDDQASSFQYNRTYEFLFADGSTRSFGVLGESE